MLRTGVAEKDSRSRFEQKTQAQHTLGSFEVGDIVAGSAAEGSCGTNKQGCASTRSCPKRHHSEEATGQEMGHNGERVVPLKNGMSDQVVGKENG